MFRKICWFFSAILFCADASSFSDLPNPRDSPGWEIVLSERYGKLAIFKNRGGPDELRFEGQRVYVQQGIALKLLEKYSLADQDLLLLRDSPVDQGCHSLYLFVAVKAGGKVTVSPEFGTCGSLQARSRQDDKIVLKVLDLKRGSDRDDRPVTEYAYYLSGRDAGLLTENGATLVETRATPSVSEKAPFDIQFRLPPGYKHVLPWIVDGQEGLCGNTLASEFLGYLWKPGGLAIGYHFRPASPLDRHRVDQHRDLIVEYREETLEGRPVRIATGKNGVAVVYLAEDPPAQFEARVRSRAELDEMLGIVLSYTPCPGNPGACRQRGTVLDLP